MRIKIKLALALTLSLNAAVFGQTKISDQPDDAGGTSNKPSETTTIKSLAPAPGAELKITSTGPDATPAPKAPASVSANGGWRSELTPYVWLAGLDGVLRVRGTSVTVPRDFGDILSALEFAFAVRFDTFKGRFGLLFDDNYINLGKNVSDIVPAPGSGTIVKVTRIDSDMNLIEIAAAYRPTIIERGGSSGGDGLPVLTIDFYGGARIIYAKQALEGKDIRQNAVKSESSNTFALPMIGQRLKFSPARALTLSGKYDIGLSSEVNWSAEGLVELHLLRRLSLGGGYRVQEISQGKSNDNIGLRVQLRGPILTFALRF